MDFVIYICDSLVSPTVSYCWIVADPIPHERPGHIDSIGMVRNFEVDVFTILQSPTIFRTGFRSVTLSLVALLTSLNLAISADRSRQFAFRDVEEALAGAFGFPSDQMGRKART